VPPHPHFKLVRNDIREAGVNLFGYAVAIIGMEEPQGIGYRLLNGARIPTGCYGFHLGVHQNVHQIFTVRPCYS
jgi:hypothetical protein